MRRIKIELGEGRSYEALVGSGIAKQLPQLARGLGSRQGFLLADSRLAKQAKAMEKAFRAAGWRIESALIEAGEAAKDYRRVFPLFTRLIESGMDRHSVVFALGGGVIGDIAGFLAGTYLRGIPWVGIPTTLVAQVDSSIGGKTGVNHPLGKNLIGVFHQPSLVVCDITFLKTLSPRDRVSGLGEIVKCALAYDAPFFRTLTRDYKKILALGPKETEAAVAKALAWKADVVSRDEYERTGLRRTLNLGHTLGHALESVGGYRLFRHGEAVLTGLRLAAALSTIRGHLKVSELAEVESFLEMIEVPDPPRGLKLETLLPFIKRDKKAKGGKVTFVLLKRIGKTVADDGVTESDIADAFGLLEIPLG